MEEAAGLAADDAIIIDNDSEEEFIVSDRKILPPLPQPPFEWLDTRQIQRPGLAW